MRVRVATKVAKITMPTRKKLLRMPIQPGSTPPTSGPTRLPAMMPAARVPSAHPVRAFGDWVATSTLEPDE